MVGKCRRPLDCNIGLGIETLAQSLVRRPPRRPVMKKISALLPFLILVAACGSRPATNKVFVVPDTKKVGETKPTATVSQAEMEVREKATWEALEKKNFGVFADLLAPDYLEVGDDGVFDKTALVN